MDCFGLKKFLGRNCCFCGSDDASLTDEGVYPNGKENAAYATEESDYAASETYTGSDAHRDGAENPAYTGEEDSTRGSEINTNYSGDKIVQQQPKLLSDVRFDRQISDVSDFNFNTNEKGLTEMVLEEIEKSFSHDQGQNIQEQQDVSQQDQSTSNEYDDEISSPERRATPASDNATWRSKLIDDLNDDIEFEDISSDEEVTDATTRERGEIRDSSSSYDESPKLPSFTVDIPTKLAPRKTIICEGQPVVVDLGSYEIKAGFAGEYLPAFEYRTVIGNWGSHLGEGFQNKLDDTFFGDEAMSKHTMITRRYPIQGGEVTDWKDLEKMLDYTFSKLLEIDAKDHPVLITEPSTINKRQRERKLEIIMESLHCRMVQFKQQAVLSSLSAGKDISLVVSSGHGYTEVVPVYYGYALNHAVQRMNVGGKHVTEYLSRLLLEERGANFTSATDQLILESIKHRYAQVLPDESFESKHWTKQVSYELPDGEILQLGRELHRCTDPLFQPGLIGQDGDGGVDTLIRESLKSVDSDIHQQMKSTVLLSGGNSCLRGFKEHLHEKLLLDDGSKSSKTNWKIDSCENLKTCAWLGGSLYADNDSFRQSAVTDDAYFEYGPSIIHRTCL
ncbi:uncharacterized protein LOC120325886 isoform X2 [Styela clava]